MSGASLGKISIPIVSIYARSDRKKIDLFVSLPSWRGAFMAIYPTLGLTSSLISSSRSTTDVGAQKDVIIVKFNTRTVQQNSRKKRRRKSKSSAPNVVWLWPIFGPFSGRIKSVTSQSQTNLRLNKIFTHAIHLATSNSSQYTRALPVCLPFTDSMDGITQRKKRDVYLSQICETQRKWKLIEYDITGSPLQTRGPRELSRSFTLRTNSSMSHLILLGIASEENERISIHVSLLRDGFLMTRSPLSWAFFHARTDTVDCYNLID